MKVLVMGSGAVGGYFGAKLARAGEDVYFVSRGPHLEAMRRSGLRINSPTQGDFTVSTRTGTTTEAVQAGPYDLVLFATKSYDTEAAAAQILPALGPGTVVLCLQNGIDNEAVLGKVLGAGRVMGGVAYIEAALVEPGVIRHSAAGRVIVGELNGSLTPRAQAVHDLFARGGIPCELSPDIAVAKWEKLLFNCALNPMTALARQGIASIVAIPEGLDTCRRVMEEVRDVARAAGVALPEDTVQRLLRFATGADMHSSMEYDLLHGRPLELEALNGVVLRLGRRQGVQTPVNEALYALLKAIAPG